jgi:adenine-specific DNA-methyltransferase
MDARYKNPDNDPRGPWKSVDMSARNRYDAGIYSVTTPSGRVIAGPPTGRYWGISEESFLELDADNRIWWGSRGDNAPAVKRFLSEVSGGRTPQTLWFYEEVGHTQDAKKTLLKYVNFEHTENVLNSVKPVELIQRILQLAGDPNDDDLILDFFSGSGTTAHAVLKQNAEDGGNRRFIAVQIDEPLPTPEPSFNSILGMSLARLRNVSAEIQATLGGGEHDLGYRLTRIDTSSLADVHLAPDETSQDLLTDLESSIKPDRSDEDLLFQVLLDWGLDLNLPITREVPRERERERERSSAWRTTRSSRASARRCPLMWSPTSRNFNPSAQSSATRPSRQTRNVSMQSRSSESCRRTRRSRPYDLAVLGGEA